MWRPSYEALIDALGRTAHLNSLGTIIAYGQMIALLGNRLRLHALWRRRPEILERPLAAPIVVLGQMRSGSTRVQRLLACDPRLSHTRFFESWNPVPVAPRFGVLDDRRLRGWFALQCARLINPGFSTVHPTATAAPDEEIGWQSMAFFGTAFEAQWRVPGFSRYCEQIDPEPVYREFRAILQTVGWLRGADATRPWVLKIPQFTQDLPALLSVFPDARLICLDREPEAVVASSASLAYNQMALQSDDIDPAWVGREWLDKVALRERRMRRDRARAPQAQIDLTYADMGRDWIGEMRRVYEMLRLPLEPWVVRRMASYLRRSQRRHVGRHRYALADFGLTAGNVRAAVGVATSLRQAG